MNIRSLKPFFVYGDFHLDLNLKNDTLKGDFILLSIEVLLKRRMNDIFLTQSKIKLSGDMCINFNHHK